MNTQVQYELDVVNANSAVVLESYKDDIQKLGHIGGVLWMQEVLLSRKMQRSQRISRWKKIHKHEAFKSIERRMPEALRTTFIVGT